MFLRFLLPSTAQTKHPLLPQWRDVGEDWAEVQRKGLKERWRLEWDENWQTNCTGPGSFLSPLLVLERTITHSKLWFLITLRSFQLGPAYTFPDRKPHLQTAGIQGMNLAHLYILRSICYTQKNRDLKSFSVCLNKDQNQTALRCASCDRLWAAHWLSISLRAGPGCLEKHPPLDKAPFEDTQSSSPLCALMMEIFWDFCADQRYLFALWHICPCLSCWKSKSKSTWKPNIFSASLQGDIVHLE